MQATTDRIRAFAEWALVAGFLGALWLPILDGLLRLDPTPPGVENAPAPGFPVLRLTRHDLTRSGLPVAFRRWGAGLRDFSARGFGFRLALMRLHNAAQYQVLGRSGSSVVLGRGGWLHYPGEGNLDEFRTARRFSRAELQAYGKALADRRDWLRARGIAYLFVLAPSPHTIYPEFLPENLVKVREVSRLDQLVSYLTEHTDVDLLDLRPALRAAKARGRLYHRTDSHWNERGAFVAYRAIIGYLQRWFPEIRPLDPSEVVETTETGPGGDLAGMLALRDREREEQILVVPRRPRRARTPEGGPLPYETIVVKIRPRVESEVPDESLPRAVVIRDSYGSALVPLLSEHFRRAVYVWMEFDADLIARERPDVVIEEAVERLAVGAVPVNPPGLATGR